MMIGTFWRGSAALIFGGLFFAQAGCSDGAIAQVASQQAQKVVLGLAISEPAFLPIYVAQEKGFFEKHKIQAEIVTFRGGSDLTRALVAESVDIGLASPTSVIAAINASQDVRVFFGGFNQAPFEWYAKPAISGFDKVAGARLGVSRFGSLTDALTRYVLTRNGIDPKRDVKIIQAGGPSEQLAAMDTAQLDVGIFSWPQNFMAEARGYKILYKQADLVPDFPFQSFFAMKNYLDKNQVAAVSVIKAFRDSVDYIQTHQDESATLLSKYANIPLEDASRTLKQLLPGWRKDGRLASDEGIKAFFEVMTVNGDVDRQWEAERYWDRRIIEALSQ